MSFDKLTGTKKGYIGEDVVDKYLDGIGVIPYAPVIHIAHPFDRLCATKDKQHIFIAEVKTKASRTFYPDTGIDVRSYNTYKDIQDRYGIGVWLFFVDEYKMQIYGNLLEELDKIKMVFHNEKFISYPFVQKTQQDKEIRYFPLDSMKVVSTITEEIAEQLKELSNRSYKYE